MSYDKHEQLTDVQLLFALDVVKTLKKSFKKYPDDAVLSIAIVCEVFDEVIEYLNSELSLPMKGN
jgi:hypothetical protein